jgi:ribonuclease-3
MSYYHEFISRGKGTYKVGIQGLDRNVPEILKLFSEKTLTEIESVIEYKFRDKELLALAFTHSSFANERNQKLLSRSKTKSEVFHNERLEFLGDSVLQTIISNFLYSNLPLHSEGELTELRTYIVGFSVATHYALKLGLDNYVLVGNGEEFKGEGRRSILADLFEALLGAIFTDGGMPAASDFFLKHFENDLHQIIMSPKYNYKKALQEFSAKTCKVCPVYKTEAQPGADKSSMFKTSVSIADDVLGTGTGRSKQAAEQEAAAMALSYISDVYQQHYDGLPSGVLSPQLCNPTALSKEFGESNKFVLSKRQPSSNLQNLEPSPSSGPIFVSTHEIVDSNVITSSAQIDMPNEPPKIGVSGTRYGQGLSAVRATPPYLAQDETSSQFNFKGELKELAERVYGEQCVHYNLLEKEGTQHEPIFVMEVCVNGDKIATGRGVSKKKAGQEAARNALEIITSAKSKESSISQSQACVTPENSTLQTNDSGRKMKWSTTHSRSGRKKKRKI